MAIYHCHLKIISRASGRSATGASAYRACEKIKDQNSGAIHDYTKKGGIVHTEIIMPERAPERMKNRSALWNEVEKAERRKDAQLAREVEVALPIELDLDQQIQLVKNFASENFVREGMIADIAIHNKADGNPHAHVMLTMREISPEGFGKKERAWNDRANVERWREGWELAANSALEKAGHTQRIDHRSLADQGVRREPTVHLGPNAAAMERRGIQTGRGDLNRLAAVTNELRKQWSKLAKAIKAEVGRQETENIPAGNTGNISMKNIPKKPSQAITEAQNVGKRGNILPGTKQGPSEASTQRPEEQEKRIEQLEKYLRSSYRPGSYGFAGQVKSAKELCAIESKRGMKPEEIAKKYPRAADILTKDAQYREREQGKSR